MADNSMYSTLKKTIASTPTMGGTTALQAMQSALNNAPTVKPPTSNTTTKKPTSSSSSASTSAADSYAAYLAQLQAQRQQAAYDAYNRAVSRIDDAYNSAASNFANVYNRGASTLQGAYNNSANKVNDQAKSALQEAYVNRMRSQKDLSQQLAAQGISGGASESAMAGLINNYGNARNGIQKTWDTNLADLEQTYNSNLSNLYSAYQSQMAALANQRANALNAAESALANLETSNAGSLASALLNNPSAILSALNLASGNMDNWKGEDAVATNLVDLVNTQQGNDMGSATNWAKIQEILDGAGNDTQKIQYLLQAGFPKADALYMLNQVYR